MRRSLTFIGSNRQCCEGYCCAIELFWPSAINRAPLASWRGKPCEVVNTGLILQKLLQGFFGPRARKYIIERCRAQPDLVPDRKNYTDAAELRNLCRRAGVQIGTIDALITQLRTSHKLVLLTTAQDFAHVAPNGRCKCATINLSERTIALTIAEFI